VRIGNYEVSSTIGVGTFSKVRIGRHVLSGEPVAIKIIEKKNIKDEADRNRLNL
jgi:serine/threonine protein kinase